MNIDEKTIENIAWACHEVNRIFCKVHGDHSQKKWVEAEQWQKDSAIQGVEFAIANPEVTDEMMHKSWMDTKKRDGWSYGPEKDPEKKLHPCMVPYSDLPKVQRAKDTLFRTIVLSFFD